MSTEIGRWPTQTGVVTILFVDLSGSSAHLNTTHAETHLAAGQGFALWAERYLEGVQALLNRCQLALDGLELELTGSPLANQWVLP